jgi:hypothetical protein
MDDNIIEHYSHEDTFVIDFIQDEDGNIKITLIEFAIWNRIIKEEKNVKIFSTWKPILEKPYIYSCSSAIATS